MDKDKAIRFLQALACCSESSLCDIYPWKGTKDCDDTSFSKELIVEAIKITRGE